MISYRFQTTWLDLGVDSIRIVSRIVVSRIKIKRRRFWIQTTIYETLWRALTAASARFLQLQWQSLTKASF